MELSMQTCSCSGSFRFLKQMWVGSISLIFNFIFICWSSQQILLSLLSEFPHLWQIGSIGVWGLWCPRVCLSWQFCLQHMSGALCPAGAGCHTWASIFSPSPIGEARSHLHALVTDHGWKRSLSFVYFSSVVFQPILKIIFFNDF